MIKRPADHGLYVIQLHLNLIFLATAMNSSLYRLIVATTSLHLHYTTTLLIYQSPASFLCLEKSRYKACRSNCEAGRSNPSRDLGGVTNSELTVRTVKALEDFFYSFWGSTAKKHNQSRCR